MRRHYVAVYHRQIVSFSDLVVLIAVQKIPVAYHPLIHPRPKKVTQIKTRISLHHALSVHLHLQIQALLKDDDKRPFVTIPLSVKPNLDHLVHLICSLVLTWVLTKIPSRHCLWGQ